MYVFDINKPIAIGSDHAGFEYKAALILWLKEKGYAVKITDTLNRYPTTIVPVFNTNLYVLCTTKVKSFGPKMTNNMITVEMSE